MSWLIDRAGMRKGKEGSIDICVKYSFNSRVSPLFPPLWALGESEVVSGPHSLSLV